MSSNRNKQARRRKNSQRANITTRPANTKVYHPMSGARANAKRTFKSAIERDARNAMRKLGGCSLREEQLMANFIHPFGAHTNAAVMVAPPSFSRVQASSQTARDGGHYPRMWGHPYSYKRQVSFTAGQTGGVGTVGNGYLLINPIAIGNGSAATMYEALATTSAFTGGAVVTSTGTGIGQIKLTPTTAPYDTASNGIYFFLQAMTVKLMANTSSVSGRSGRISMGGHATTLNGYADAQFEVDSGFEQFDAALLDDDGIVMNVKASGHSSSINTHTTVWNGGEAGTFVVWVQDTAAFSEFVVEIEWAGFYWGDLVDPLAPISISQDWHCAQSCLATALGPCRVRRGRDYGEIQNESKKNAEHNAVLEEPGFSWPGLLDGLAIAGKSVAQVLPLLF